ncbi:hypothetical protein [Paraburkholderia xenovorans]
MITLAFEDQRHFIGVLALKGDGTLDNQCAPELLNRIVAQRLWVDYAVIGEVKKRLAAVGLIDDNWQPLAWEKRQMRSDSSTDRVRAHREKSKRSGNGDGTLQQRSSNGLDTDTEEDTEEDKEEEKDKDENTTQTRKRAASASSTDQQDGERDDGKPLTASALVAEGVERKHARDWLTLRKAKRLPLTQTAWDGVKEEAAACGMTPAAAVKYAVEADWAGFKASWVTKRGATGAPAASRAAAPNKQEALEANNRAVAQRVAEKFQAQQGAA